MDFLEPGTRTTIAGTTGSGKSTFAVTIIRHSRQKWIIIDPKKDDKIARLKPAYVESLDAAAVAKAWETNQYVSVLPPPGSKPFDIDALILEMFEGYSNFGVYVDELYAIHKGSQFGPGLQAILTRGRSDKITFLGLTQRPRWVSLFCFSEAEFIATFSLNIPDDRRRIYEVVGVPDVLEKPVDKHGAFWYEQGSDRVIRLRLLQRKNRQAKE